MKQTIKSILSLLLALAMVFSIVGCGDSSTDSNIDTGNEVTDDFFADNETVTGGDEDTDSKDSSSNNGSSKDSSTNNDSSSKGSSSNSSSSKKNSSIAKENSVGGKTWNQVLASMPKKLRGTTVTMYNWNPPSEYAGAPTVIEEFEKATGIKVQWNTINFEVYTTRLASLVAAGESPDMVRTRTPVASRLVDFQPLSAAKFDFTDEAWDQVLMDDYTVNGVTYATSLKNTHLGSVAMMFYNKELINKLDFEDPYILWKNGKWTLNKFIEMCKEYLQEDENAAFGCTGAWFETFSQLYGVAGPVGYDGKKYYSNAKNSTFLTVTQKVADWYIKDKYIMYGSAEVFDGGKSLFYSGASVYARRKNSYFGTLKQNGTFYAVPMPSVDGQSTYYQARDEYEAYAIAQGAKNPEAVPYFLRYFLDGANYELDNFFCNKQNLEVYNWCMSQKNTIWSTGYSLVESDFGSYESTTGIYSKTGNQIKSFIDSNSAAIDKTVSTYNNAMKQLAK